MGVLSSKEGGNDGGTLDVHGNVINSPPDPDKFGLNLHEETYRRTASGSEGSAKGSGTGGGTGFGFGEGSGGEAEQLVAVFRWEHGGNEVFISGTFNGWKTKIPMHRGGNDFTYICSLPRGKHAYKFLVDGEWRFSPDQPTLADAQGNVNNLLDLTNFRSTLDDTRDWRDHIVADEDLGQEMPSREDYGQEPPFLPPQLRHIILNHTAPEIYGVHLPIPQHVTLNHLYCTAIKDGLMVLGVTNRYKEKYITTITYSLQDNTFEEVANQHRNLMKQNAAIHEEFNQLSRSQVGSTVDT